MFNIFYAISTGRVSCRFFLLFIFLLRNKPTSTRRNEHYAHYVYSTMGAISRRQHNNIRCDRGNDIRIHTRRINNNLSRITRVCCDRIALALRLYRYWRSRLESTALSPWSCTRTFLPNVVRVKNRKRSKITMHIIRCIYNV